MTELGPVTENEMVLAFLKGEIDSPRFGPRYLDILARSGLSRVDLIDNGDTQVAQDNYDRIQLLGFVRGYVGKNWLFSGFPDNVRWRRAVIDRTELGKVKYAKYRTWVDLSGGTRLVVDGAQNISSVVTGENANENVKAVAGQVRKGKRYPPLIAVEADGGYLVLVEGHTRATAYVLAPPREGVEIFVGSSDGMSGWAFY